MPQMILCMSAAIHRHYSHVHMYLYRECSNLFIIPEAYIPLYISDADPLRSTPPSAIKVLVPQIIGQVPNFR